MDTGPYALTLVLVRTRAGLAWRLPAKQRAGRVGVAAARQAKSNTSLCAAALEARSAQAGWLDRYHAVAAQRLMPSDFMMMFLIMVAAVRLAVRCMSLKIISPMP